MTAMFAIPIQSRLVRSKKNFRNYNRFSGSRRREPHEASTIRRTTVAAFFDQLLVRLPDEVRISGEPGIVVEPQFLAGRDSGLRDKNEVGRLILVESAANQYLSLLKKKENSQPLDLRRNS